ncbi:pyridoxal phosphate-dependent aminotransferase [Planococcus lenghuensis]|uniref:Aminotransferase n=1 Tax=Planococcus lenghuensis TaxID=2213202 RepID=A0A1Q2L1G9_9BACL|nr:aminotransferase class I/II-fold pyridoxal phosphate-dependent enzyme [Planococcus lenghuensis]AQQ54315.1 threonine-phosphate decarboxylase [Planococcus lenghuensis]
MNLPDHGANPLRLYKELNLEPPVRLLDFSENVHPFGPPDFIRQQWPALLPAITRYPDPAAEPFRTAAASFHSVSPDQVAASNGAAEVFTWLARRYRGKRVLLAEPAFSEYRKTLEAEGAQVKTIQLEADDAWALPVNELAPLLADCAAFYICNPHNPTGALIRPEDMKRIAGICRTADCELVIDEAFMDFAGEAFSFVPQLSANPHVTIIRSMTKMYALPGLRLGYVLGQGDVIRELTAGAAHWNVNALAAAIGAQCFKESGYRRMIREAAVAERQKMTAFLSGAGCKVTDSAVNFLSFRLPPSYDPARFLKDMLQRGLILRHTYSFNGMDGEWFRIGMKSSADMEALREAIAGWLRGN